MPLVKYGGVLMKMRSSAASPRTWATRPAFSDTARSVWQTPLGTPVVPDVNMIIASSSGRTGSRSPAGAGHGAEGAVPAPAGRSPATRPSASAVITSRNGVPACRPSPSGRHASSLDRSRACGCALAISRSTSRRGKLTFNGTTTSPASHAPIMATKNWS